MSHIHKTSVVILSSLRRAAVATVLVEGPDAVEAVSRHFASPHITPKAMRLNRIHFGTWENDGRSEDLVICRTDPDRFEIHCHGGRMAATSIADSLTKVGVQRIAYEAWLRRATDDDSPTSENPRSFEDKQRLSVGKTSSDPRTSRLPCSTSVDMARSLLPASPTLRTTTVLLDQLRGAMSKELVHIKSLVRAGQRQTALTRTSGLLDRADLGRHLVNRWSVVIAGHPNAGKSSLINRLLGYERAVVFDQPGTTRDLITVDTAFDGWPVTITDTAGLRGSQNQIEIEGIRLATETIAKADLVILVEDMSCHSTVCVEDFALADKEQRRLVVGTKLDLLAGSAITRPSYDATTSALTGEGILGLGRLIAAALVTQPPPAGAGVPLSADEVAQIERVHRQLAAGDLATAAEIVDLMTADLPSRS